MLKTSIEFFVPPARPDILRGGPLAHQQPGPAFGRLHTLPHSLINPSPHLWHPSID